MRWDLIAGIMILFAVFTMISNTIEVSSEPFGEDPTAQFETLMSPSQESRLDSTSGGKASFFEASWEWLNELWDALTFDHAHLNDGGWGYVRSILFLPIGIGVIFIIAYLMLKTFSKIIPGV